MVNSRRKPGISSSLIMLENQSVLFFSSIYLYLQGWFRPFHADHAQPYISFFPLGPCSHAHRYFQEGYFSFFFFFFFFSFLH